MSAKSFRPVILDSAMTRSEARHDNPHFPCPPTIRLSQELLHLRYWSFDQRLHQGQLVVDESLADTVRAIFDELLDIRFLIAKMVPIIWYDWDDEKSMQDNNSSGFNFRPIAGTDRLSWHAYGRAIDINPLLNPYIKGTVVAPKGAVYNPSQPGTITENSAIVQIFKAYGWLWGGHWSDLKDFQHFEKPFLV